MILHIGIDDTDSPKGGCTTYIAALLIESLSKLDVTFLDWPTLLRLNPNTPWKTRGNASICIRLKINKNLKEYIIEDVLSTLEKHSRFDCENTNPGIVFHFGTVPDSIKAFSHNAVQSIVTLRKADELIKKNGALGYGFKNRRGIIGALAAIGGLLEYDHTYELLTFRQKQYIGTKRLVDKKSVLAMNELFYQQTFNNCSSDGKTIFITPNGPDPVLYGIRGETPNALTQASKLIKVYEPIERWEIFVTNQGTDAHFSRVIKIKDAQEYNPTIIQAELDGSPKTIRGGHDIFKIKDETGGLYCAAYEPTGSFRRVIRKLVKGDKIQAFGAIKKTKKGLTLNLEKITILELREIIITQNPKCPKCKGSMESMGKNSGYRCKKCKFRGDKLRKTNLVLPRNLHPGVYIPDSGAQRHLTKPLKRYGKEKNNREPIDSQ
jgi:tRNA(Ile2)-agmatinylcytidine synthase